MDPVFIVGYRAKPVNQGSLFCGYLQNHRTNNPTSPVHVMASHHRKKAPNCLSFALLEGLMHLLTLKVGILLYKTWVFVLSSTNTPDTRSDV